MKKTPIQSMCDLLAEFLENSPTTADDPNLDKALLIAELLEHQKRNKFEFNELVQVRRWEGDEWQKRRYVGWVETWHGIEYLTFKANQDATRHRHKEYKSWGQIRKIEKR